MKAQNHKLNPACQKTLHCGHEFVYWCIRYLDGNGYYQQTPLGGSVFPLLPGVFPDLPEPPGDGLCRLVSQMRGENRNEGFADRVNQPLFSRGLKRRIV